MIPVAVEDEITIRRARGEVFAFLSDHEHLPAWMVGVKRAQRTSTGPLGVGTTYRVVGRMAGRKVEFTYELTAYQPDEMFSGRWVSPLFSFDETYKLEQEDGSTVVRLVAEAAPGTELRFLWPVIALAVPRQIKADHRRLQTILQKRKRTRVGAPASAPERPEPEADVREE